MLCPGKASDRPKAVAGSQISDGRGNSPASLLPVQTIIEKDCVLFLWTTSPHLCEALVAIDECGFQYKIQYKRYMVWVKHATGMGYYARQSHEHLLIAPHGNPETPEPSNRLDSVIEALRRQHSVKPASARETIERM